MNYPNHSYHRQPLGVSILAPESATTKQMLRYGALEAVGDTSKYLVLGALGLIVFMLLPKRTARRIKRKIL